MEKQPMDKEPEAEKESSSESTRVAKRRKRLSTAEERIKRDLAPMMYGFGDVPRPASESIDVLYDMVQEFVGTVTHKGLNRTDSIEAIQKHQQKFNAQTSRMVHSTWPKTSWKNYWTLGLSQNHSSNEKIDQEPRSRRFRRRWPLKTDPVSCMFPPPSFMSRPPATKHTHPLWLWFPVSNRNPCLLCREMQACGKQSAKSTWPQRNCLLCLDIDSNTEKFQGWAKECTEKYRT